VLLVVSVAASAVTYLVPAIVSDRPTKVLDGTGLTSIPVFVQDLAFWLPAMALLGWLLWRSHPAGTAAAAAGLVFWQLEAVGVACDHWFGHRADPTSAVASAGAVGLFAALFVVGLVPTWTLLRRVS
jgi:hypothetical protein